ncbi:MAG: tripartite tricarboxylate transporter substrate-binding protein, partial [Burkholderiaceae bacterium]
AWLGVGPALAQDDKSPITLLVGAASTMDATARLVAEHLKDALGRPVVVQSKLGAGGRVALGELKRAAPDGRVLMFSTSSPFAIYPHIYTKLDYDPVADFTPITGVAWFDLGLATGPATPATDLAQLINWAKAKGNEVVYGAAPGAGSSSHFAGIALTLAANLQMGVVPYKDSGAGITDIVAGRLPILITGTGALTEMHRAGRLRILATSGPQRSPIVKDVPTFVESGVNVNIINSAGLYGPAKMAPEFVARLHTAMAPYFQKSDVREKMALMGMSPEYASPQQLAATLADERKKYQMLVKASGYVAEAS